MTDEKGKEYLYFVVLAALACLKQLDMPNYVVTSSCKRIADEAQAYCGVTVLVVGSCGKVYSLYFHWQPLQQIDYYAKTPGV